MSKVGGAHAKVELDLLKGWLALHNAAVMAVLFVVFGVDLIAKGVPPLTTLRGENVGRQGSMNAWIRGRGSRRGDDGSRACRAAHGSGGPCTPTCYRCRG